MSTNDSDSELSSDCPNLILAMQEVQNSEQTKYFTSWWKKKRDVSQLRFVFVYICGCWEGKEAHPLMRDSEFAPCWAENMLLNEMLHLYNSCIWLKYGIKMSNMYYITKTFVCTLQDHNGIIEEEDKTELKSNPDSLKYEKKSGRTNSEESQRPSGSDGLQTSN